MLPVLTRRGAPRRPGGSEAACGAACAPLPMQPPHAALAAAQENTLNRSIGGWVAPTSCTPAASIAAAPIVAARETQHMQFRQCVNAAEAQIIYSTPFFVLLLVQKQPSHVSIHRAEKVDAEGHRPVVPREQLTDDMDLPGADVLPPAGAPLGCGALPADQVPWVAETWALLRRFQGAIGMQTLPSLHALEVRMMSLLLHWFGWERLTVWVTAIHTMGVCGVCSCGDVN